MNVAGRKIVESIATSGSRRLERLECRFDIARHLQCVALRLFLDDQHQAGAALMTASPIGGGKPSTTSATSPMRSALLDAPVAAVPRGDGQRRAAPPDDDLRRSSDRRDGRRVRDGQPLLRRFEEAAGADRRAFARRGDHVVQRDVVRAQAIGIDQDLQLPIALAPDRHVGDAGNRHQPRADRPLGQRRHLDLRQTLGRDADLHHAAERGQRREDHRRVRRCRQARGDAQQPLLHELPRAHQVRALARRS